VGTVGEKSFEVFNGIVEELDFMSLS